MSVKHKIDIFEKMYDILMILVEIFHDFRRFFATRIRIRFIKTGRIWLTKMKRIETDPDPKHCFFVIYYVYVTGKTVT